jgi:hypothetical protein
METKTINIFSNYIYLFCGLYLFTQKLYIYGTIAIIVWFVSHMYHLDIDDCFWDRSDTIIATICFVFILINCKDVLCKKYIIYLMLTLSFLFSGIYFCRNDEIHKYDIIHSIWHILSALFITNLVIKNNKLLLNSVN